MSVTFGNCSMLPCLLIFVWQFVGISDKSIPTAFLHENQHEAFLLKCQSAHCSWAFIILNGKQINYFVYLLFYLNWNNAQYVICFNGLNKTFKLFLNMSNTGNVGWGVFFVCFSFCFVPHPFILSRKITNSHTLLYFQICAVVILNWNCISLPIFDCHEYFLRFKTTECFLMAVQINLNSNDLDFSKKHPCPDFGWDSTLFRIKYENDVEHTQIFWLFLRSFLP